MQHSACAAALPPRLQQAVKGRPRRALEAESKQRVNDDVMAARQPARLLAAHVHQLRERHEGDAEVGALRDEAVVQRPVCGLGVADLAA